MASTLPKLFSRPREERSRRTNDDETGRGVLEGENETPWIARTREYKTRRENKEKERESARAREREERNGESEEEIRARMERDRETWKDRTEEWLCDAAMRGDVESLKEIMKTDGYILDKVLVGSFKGKNPLHMATSTGQKEFVLELLEYKQDLARAIDTELGTALHIASSKGYLEIVKLLVEVSPEMCAARDREGNNPLHIAAMKGNDDVLKVLLQTNPRAARLMVDRGDNILHLCVNYNQLESLKQLLDKMGDKGFVNFTDINGNNILHLAVFGKRCEIIKHLLLEQPIKEKKDGGKLGQLIDVNARNGSGWTALDIHSQVAESEDQNSEYRDIGKVLHKSGVKRSNKLFFPFDPYWQKKKKDTLMIVSSLMATMSFQVGINPPGGVWDNSSPDGEYKAGKARIAYTYSEAYPYLMFFNTVGFLLSLTTILELIVGLPTQKRGFGFFRAGISWLTIMIMAFAYTFSVIVVSPTKNVESTSLVILITVVVWAVLISFLRVLPHQAQVILLGVSAIGIPVVSVMTVAPGPLSIFLICLSAGAIGITIFFLQKARRRTKPIQSAVQILLGMSAIGIPLASMEASGLGPLSISLICLSAVAVGITLLLQMARSRTKPIESSVQSTGDSAASPPNPTAVSQNDSSVSIEE
ncbi:hypothetical protein RHMOL_Rhmol01G0036200 [Rhododendron molle]|uniref:Uncharacterized protein n=1 Tax=Rhododendron molle TaxID=49168 RepID=A0ACC0PXR6_RHOML|nr:hypothetical protein RHMOL_Rhmol01G0036200 [Rhododendron molle]